MTEERRAAPAPNAVDASAPELDGSAPQRAVRDSSPARRPRGRMTLRIPDDEVVRPQGDTGDPGPVRALSRPPSMAPTTPDPGSVTVTPMRIISITSDLPPAGPADEENTADNGPTLTATQESWLPPSAGFDTIEDENPPIEEGEEEVEVVAHIQMDGAIHESMPPADVEPISAEPTTDPAVSSGPSSPQVLVGAEAHADGEEEVRFEDDALTPALPGVEPARSPALDVAAPSDGERRSDPGDAPEIAAEDLVAVEAAPKRLAVELPPMRARAPSQPPLPPVGKSVAPAVPQRPPLVIVPPHVGSMAPQGPESIGPRRKGRLWWEDLFNDDYLRTMEKITDAQIAREADFIETSLGLERGGAMLDLACGTGRQAIELARRSYQVVAFDLSLAMLARAGDEAQERDVRLNFVQGDMREMSFEAQFDGVYCWNTSFGYFDEEKNAQVIDRVHKSLKSGGLFLLDVVNRDFIIRQSPSLAWFEGDGCVCMDEMTVDFITSRMKVKRTLMLDDGRSRELEYSMRVYSLHELGKILHEHGFKVCEVTGRVGTPGVYFGNESPRTIILAEKR